MIVRLRMNRNGTLSPLDEGSKEVLAAIPKGAVREFSITGIPVDPLLHRKFHKMFHLLWENYPENGSHTSRGGLRDDILIKAGFYATETVNVDSEQISVFRAKSIAKAVIDQDTFRKLFRECHKVILRDYGELVPKDFVKRFY